VLISLELFDIESKVNYEAILTSLHPGFGIVPAIESVLNTPTQMKTGWRIYDPATRTILDEFVISKQLTLSGGGINLQAAASILVGRNEAVKQAGNLAGQAYADRILPYWIRVSRDYFVRGNDNFVIAKRKAQAGDWDGAAQLWSQSTSSSNRKISGRACYNMAIISEINGDLDGAIHWAQKSYEDYDNRLALSYINILKFRKSQSDILKSQSVATNGQ
jgi:hypothetical protein